MSDLDRAYKIICELLRQAGGSARIPKAALELGAAKSVRCRQDGDELVMRVGGQNQITEGKNCAR